MQGCTFAFQEPADTQKTTKKAARKKAAFSILMSKIYSQCSTKLATKSRSARNSLTVISNFFLAQSLIGTF